VNRRRVLNTGAALLAWPSLLLAQAEKHFRIGFLVASSEAAGKPYIDAFVSELRDLGYVVGRNLVVDVRHADGDSSRFSALAEELVGLKPDLLAGVEWTARALQAKTSTVPIVLTSSTDPVGAGLIKSLARPGTNVTGLAFRLDELIAKQIEFLAEIAPKMSRVALFSYAPLGNDDPGAPIAARWEESARMAARARRLQLIVTRARDSRSLSAAFAEVENARAEGLVLTPVFTWFQLLGEILGHTQRLRLPSITALSASWVQAGGLAYYGPDLPKAHRLAAGFMDRILRGANPAEMPVEHPGSFEFVVNLRAAREIGVKLPPSILLRADQVIE
jgi:putative ABC transport system substrate-binding protein